MSRRYSGGAAASFGNSRDVSGDFVEIPLSRGLVALVDRECLPLIEGPKWQAKRSGPGSNGFYAVRREGPRVARRTIWMHRLILGAGRGEFVDHINRDGLDNRRANLRKCSHSDNCANRGWRRGASGFRGVRIQHGAFHARISPGPKLQPKSIGTFATAEEAARAYDRAAVERFGQFAQLNFPEAIR